MNGILWVVERKIDGEWVSFVVEDTRADARVFARWGRSDYPGCQFRIRKYARVEE